MNMISMSEWIEKSIDQYPPGYLEVLTSVSVQLAYMIFGLFIEKIRPSYASGTSRKVMVKSLSNHVIATMAHVALVMFRRGDSVLTRTFIRPYGVPSWREFMSDLIVGLLLRDALFYIIHRLWHTPAFYKLVHAKHHELQEPGEHHVWTISYMSVADFLILYGGSVVVVAKILEMNILTTWVFGFVSAAGEQVKIVWGGEAHDEHHANMTVNYGVYGFLDGVLGTSSAVGGEKGKVN